MNIETYYDVPDDPARTAGPGELEGDEDQDREPPEDDGECWRGGEYAAFIAERQAWVQRNLK